MMSMCFSKWLEGIGMYIWGAYSSTYDNVYPSIYLSIYAYLPACLPTYLGVRTYVVRTCCRRDASTPQKAVKRYWAKTHTNTTPLQKNSFQSPKGLDSSPQRVQNKLGTREQSLGDYSGVMWCSSVASVFVVRDTGHSKCQEDGNALF